MKGLKTSIISILAIGLLAGSAVGVAAQDEGASAFTLSFEGPPVEHTFDEATQIERLVFDTVATDPRVSGLITVVAARGGVVDDEQAFYGYSKEGLRLVNDGGAWVGTVVNFDARDPDERTKKQKKNGKGKRPLRGAGGLIEMTGEGGYEGLSMIASFGGGDILGMIVPTDTVPMQPDPPPATEAAAE